MKKLVLFVLCLSPKFILAQILSLASYDPGKTHAIQVAPNQDLTIVLKDLIPFLTNYRLDWSSKTEELPTLNVTRAGAAALPTPCDILNTNLEKSKSEKEVRDLLKNIPAGCSTIITSKGISSAELILNSPFGRAKLNFGETLILVVTRENNVANGISDAVSWTFELSPGSQGKWNFSYGANFFNLMNRDEEYYLDNDRKIQKVEKEYWKSVVKPMAGIFITFFPAHKLAKKAFVGFSAGYTTNFQSNNFFAGASVVVRQTVLLHANIGIRQVARLKGKYIKDFKNPPNNYMVPNGVEAKDLMEDNFMPDFSIGISFRLKDNPFTTNNTPN